MLGARYGVGRSRHDGERFATVSRGVGMTSTRSPRIEIEYCTGCRWGLRAGWVAQELLVTFEAELGAEGSLRAVFGVDRGAQLFEALSLGAA